VFTGIIETTGTIREINVRGPSIRLGVAPAAEEYSGAEGASLSVDGTCLTLESSRGGILYFTAVKETLSRTTLGARHVGDTVNLERALSLAGRLDGHFVLGHVDAVGTIASDTSDGIALVRTIRIPPEIARFCAEKGSVALDGISLTITRAAAAEFDVSVVPFTLEKTTMTRKRPGDTVNVECDVLARYLARLAEAGGSNQADVASGTLLDSLERSGF
jgi:riboflavin synthase